LADAVIPAPRRSSDSPVGHIPVDRLPEDTKSSAVPKVVALTAAALAALGLWSVVPHQPSTNNSRVSPRPHSGSVTGFPAAPPVRARYALPGTSASAAQALTDRITTAIGAGLVSTADGYRPVPAARGPVFATRPDVPAAKPPAPKPATPSPGSAAGSSAGATALAAAMGERGTPYVWGGTSPSGFDCSGLTMWSYRKAGVKLPRSSKAQSTVGTPVSKGELRPGDLVFFYSPVSHVAIYIGNGQVVHASEPGEPVKISQLSRMPFHNARRI
jgi:cell wall-associated NlpC family hydrolase